MGQIGGAREMVLHSRRLLAMLRNPAVRHSTRSAAPAGAPATLATLLDVAPALASAPSAAAVHEAVEHAVEALLGADHCRVVPLGSAREAGVTTVPADLRVSVAAHAAMQRALDTGAPVETVLPCREWLVATPIQCDRGVVACFYATRAHGGPFGQIDVELTSFVAALAGATLDHLARTEDLEDEVRRRAGHDPLTELPNRELFTDRVEQSLARGVRNAISSVVLYVDVDDFKSVNDSMSHAAGDVLLRSVAARLLGCIRPGDTVARLGGDEFGILLDGASVADAEVVAGRVVAELARPFPLPGGDRAAHVSVGIAAGRTGVNAPDDLVGDADTAMLVAKKKGKGRVEVFAPEMRALARPDGDLRSDLGSALENGELTVYYQPIISVETGRMVCAEALLRWNHPRKGLLNPADFVPLAEESGQIVPIGSWVLRQACAQAVAWQRSFPSASALEVSVNLAPRQLQHPDLVSDVAAALEDSGLDPGLLTLEITESAMVEDTEGIIATLAALKRLGLRLSIDDFGTGYSALSYLRRFDVDVLKIDRSFVHGVEDSDEAAALVWAIASLGRALHLEVVAEGVESMEQLEALTTFGCDRAQGYNWSPPVPAPMLDRWLKVVHDPGDKERDRVRVLLVDDQDHMRGAVGIALGASERYCVVAEAGDGAAALELTARHQPDLVLLDERMPGMSGSDALPGIVAAAPHATVVFLTADPVRRSAAAEPPVAAVIDKAYDLGHLVALLEPLTA